MGIEPKIFTRDELSSMDTRALRNALPSALAAFNQMPLALDTKDVSGPYSHYNARWEICHDINQRIIEKEYSDKPAQNLWAPSMKV